MESGPRRTSDASGHQEPAKLVVGFHVEGQATSPLTTSYMTNDPYKPKGGLGSPIPVIIPPSFQVRLLRPHILNVKQTHFQPPSQCDLELLLPYMQPAT